MKEVLSIPAGGTISNIKTYGIHAFPYPRNYSDSEYITFRAPKGGEMDMLYIIVCKIVLNPFDVTLETKISAFDSLIRERILKYIQARKTTKLGFEKKNHHYMFYVLKEVERLTHKPRPEGKNTAGHTYYTYKEITSGKSEVRVESKI